MRIGIPAAILSHKAAQLKESDMLAFEIKGDHLIVRKITAPVGVYLNSVSEKFNEWTASEDEDTWSDF